MMRFLNTLTGQLVVVAVLFLLIGYTLFRRYTKDVTDAAAAPVPTFAQSNDVSPLVTNPDGQAVATDEAKQSPTVVHQIGDNVSRFLVPPEPTAESRAPTIPKAVREQMLAAPVPLTLFFNEDPPPQPKPRVSDEYAPYGRLIRCKLVTALESSNLATPLIAVTLETVWNRDAEGFAHEIIPAGIEVHGPPVQRGRSRDRLEAAGTFVFVWRTDDDKNGFELPLTAIALTRDADPVTGNVGPNDASAGIQGKIIETVQNAEIRLFAAAFLDAAASSSFETTPVLNPLTNQTSYDRIPSVKNAGIAGAQAVLNEWADRIRDQIKQDGFFVAVPSGREFYLYITQTIDLSNARRGTLIQPQAVNTTSTP